MCVNYALMLLTICILHKENAVNFNTKSDKQHLFCSYECSLSAPVDISTADCFELYFLRMKLHLSTIKRIYTGKSRVNTI